MPSKLMLLSGMLLIAASLFMLFLPLANGPGHDALQTEWLERLGYIKSRKAYIKYEAKNGTLGLDSSYQFRVSIYNGNDTAGSLKIIIDSSLSDSAKAWQRKLIAESMEDSSKAHTVYSDVEVSRQDYKKYREGDTIRIVYLPDNTSVAKLKKDVALLQAAKTNIGSWLTASGLVFLLGTVLIFMYSRRKKQQQPDDVLSSYTTYSSIKKPQDFPSKGGRPG